MSTYDHLRESLGLEEARAASEYAAWLSSQDSLTPEQAASHRNWVKGLLPALKTLKVAIEREANHPGSFQSGGKFSKKEANLILAALRLLDATMVPVATMPPVKQKKIMFL